MQFIVMHSIIVVHGCVKSAFLNGDLKEEIYMQQPLGFIKPGEAQGVLDEKMIVWS